MKRLDREKLKLNIEKRINGDIEANRVGGCNVIVMQNGEVMYKNCFGSKAPGENVPLTDDTLFRMASMTKPVTVACALIQVGRGLINLDDPLEKYIPEYADMHIGELDGNGNIVDKGPARGKVKMLHLFTHTSGIGTLPVGDKQFGMMKPEERQTLETVVNYHAHTYIAFEPYTQQFYSPVVAFDILARVCELTSGKKFDEFAKTELFDKLGMKDTTFQPTEEQWGRMIGMHNLVDGKSVRASQADRCVFGDFPTTYFCGGAGLASTLNDYIKFAEMIRCEGRAASGEQIILPELIRAMRTPQVPKEVMGDPQVWGLGVRVITADTYKILPTHSFGWSGAYGTHFWVDPDNQVTAVYLKNSFYDGGAGAVTANHFEEDVTASFED